MSRPEDEGGANRRAGADAPAPGRDRPEGGSSGPRASEWVFLADAVVDAVTAAAVRARLDASGWTRYAVGDRGVYEVNERHDEPELTARLVALASERLGRPLALVDRRWTRMRRGDYALFKDDARRWQGRDRHVEVTLDLSAAASAEGQIFYARPDGAATVPQRPGTAAIVDRRGPSARYERYLGVRFGDGEVVRLVLVLADEA